MGQYHPWVFGHLRDHSDLRLQLARSQIRASSKFAQTLEADRGVWL